MSSWPDDVPAPPPTDPAAAARLLARIGADHDRARAARWESAFRREWEKAVGDTRALYDLTPLHEVIRTWQRRLAHVPAVDTFFGAGMDDEDGVDFEEAVNFRG